MAASKKIIRYRGKNATVKLTTNMNIALASQFYDETLSMFERDLGQVTFDGSDVQAIDTSAFQLMLAMIKKLDQKSVPFVWKEDVSSSLIEMAGSLGLSSDLGLSA